MGDGGRGINRWVAMRVMAMARDCVDIIGVGGLCKCTCSALVKTVVAVSGGVALNGIGAVRDEAARDCGFVV